MKGEERKGTEEGQGRDGILGWTEETWTATSCTALATFARSQASHATFLSLAEYAFFSNKPAPPAPDLSTSVAHCGPETSAWVRALTTV